MTNGDAVTIVIPVYDGFDDAVACVASVLRHAPSTDVAARIVVIDDASPDPRIRTWLDALSVEHPDIQIVHNDRNRGFVANANAAFADADGDVILLNADTIVTDGWLDGLVDAARGPDIATVTPLTNSGSICTLASSVIDAFGLDDDDPDIDGCARFIRANSIAARPEVITGVGFCMLVTRTAIDAVGPFDEVAYGRGYGEEVDFCIRAGRLGLVNIADDTTFVFHRGGVSFGDERSERMRQASIFLHKRYPFFRAANRSERLLDPLRASFTALALALDDHDPQRTRVLHVLHGPPDDVGGTEKHLTGLLDALGDEFDFTLVYPVESGFVVQTRWRTGAGATPIHEHLLPGSVRWVAGIDDPVAAESFAMALDLFTADVVHVHSFNGFSLAPLRVLEHVDAPVIAFVHDPFLACPHYSLLYLDRESCGIPEDRAVCGRCLPATEQLPVDHLDEFRATVRDHLHVVDRWVFASRSAADLLVRAYPIDPERIEIIEHAAPIDRPRPGLIDESRVLDEPLRVAFVGRGWAKKGLGAVNRLARAVAETPIEIHHFGPLRERADDHVITHGPYENVVLPDLLDRAGIQIVLLPGPTAETYGLVLSEAIIAGIPVIGAHYGALGQRIRDGGIGWTFDPTDPDELLDLIRHLDRCRREILRAAQRTLTVALPSSTEVAARYADLYRGSTHQTRGSR